MHRDEPLYKAFLDELEAIEQFRMSYTGERPGVPLGREDPDVQRLLEALAMFTARTRLASERSVKRSALRLFQQHFPYLLSPLPCMAMLQAAVSSRYVDTTTIPRGSEVRVSNVTGDGRVGQERTTVLSFRTQRALRIVPMSIQGVDMFRRQNKSYRLAVRIEGAFFRNDELGEINLYINQLNDLLSSLTVYYRLKRHFVHASVVFDADVNEETRGEPLRVYFGPPRQPTSTAETLQHPLQEARAFFRFPKQALYMNVHVDKQPRNWESFTLLFDLDARWPVQLRLNPDTFALHTVPIVNIRGGYADPIESDGTRDRYPIRHPDVDARYVVHSVRGVYKIADTELIPLRPGIVGDEPDSYELEFEGHADKRRAYAALNLPSAFESPVRVAIDAYWHQPGGADEDSIVSAIQLAERHVDGLQWELAGALSLSASNLLDDSQPALLQLLSIKNQRFLERDDLLFLLQAMGVRDERPFGELAYAIASVSVTSKPFAKKSQGFKYVYHVGFGTLDASQLPALDLFCAKLLEVLTAWSSEEVVELAVSIPNLEIETNYV